MNLLSNAVKYTPEGGTIHFTIRELPYEREGYALFQTVVEDTGIGISKEYTLIYLKHLAVKKVHQKAVL